MGNVVLMEKQAAAQNPTKTLSKLLWHAAVEMANTAAWRIMTMRTSTNKPHEAQTPGERHRVFLLPREVTGPGELLYSLTDAKHVLGQIQMAACFEDGNQPVEIRPRM